MSDEQKAEWICGSCGKPLRNMPKNSDNEKWQQERIIELNRLLDKALRAAEKAIAINEKHEARIKKVQEKLAMHEAEMRYLHDIQEVSHSLNDYLGLTAEESARIKAEHWAEVQKRYDFAVLEAKVKELEALLRQRCAYKNAHPDCEHTTEAMGACEVEGFECPFKKDGGSG